MKKIIIAGLILLFIIPFVNAQQSCTITVEDPVYDSTTADVGTTRTVSVTAKCSASSSTASLSLVTSAESGSGTLTAVTDTGASQYESVSITTSAVTKTFTISASATGSFSFYAKATTSDGGGGQSSTQYIQYVDPSSFVMTVDEDPSTTSYSSGSVGVVITVTNLLSTAQTRNITLWFNNSGTAQGAGDPLSRLVTLQGGESTQLIWNITPAFASDSGAFVRLGDNSQASTFSFSQESSGNGDTSSSGGGGGGSTTGGGGAAGKTYVLTDEQFGQGYKKELGVNDRFKFTLEKETHYVTVDTVTSSTVRINVTSEVQQATLSVGEEQKFELTGDNYYDLSVKLNAINTTSSKADLTIKKIYEEIPAELLTTTVPVETTTTPVEAPTAGVIEAAMGVSPWLIVIVIIIIIAAVGFWFYKRKTILRED